MSWSQVPGAARRQGLLADQVLLILLVIANEFHRLGIESDLPFHRGRPRLGVGLRIIDRDFDVQIPIVLPAEPFDQFAAGRDGASDVIEPGVCL